MGIATGRFLALSLVVTAAVVGQVAPARPRAQTRAGGALGEPYQRAVEIYTMKTVASSGPLRGEEIYYFKCWFCHNELAKAGPPLKGLFKRQTLIASREPVSDQTVAEKIRKGGPAMPGYQYTLNDADIADLISYIRDDRCCFESEDPPPNPRYRAR